MLLRFQPSLQPAASPTFLKLNAELKKKNYFSSL